MNNSRLALGTVQFGLQYGISNRNGIPDDPGLSDILSSAEKNGLNIIDTAAAYGNAEERLGNRGMKHFRVVSKFQKETDPVKALDGSLSRLKLRKLYGYIAHDTDDLLRFPKKWDQLQELKAAGLIQKTGFSLYNPEQLEKCFENGFVPDMVQLPFSILDRKFLSSLDNLKKIGCEIHVRSVFLQGLYLMNTSALSEKLKSMRPAIEAIQKIAENNQFTVQELALAYVLSFPQIDQIVIGVENCSQLEENISAAKKHLSPSVKSELEQIPVADSELLNPSKW